MDEGYDGAGLEVDGRVRRGAFELKVAVHAPARGVLAVLGPNGSGKSTLLRVIAGLLPLDGGTVRLAGRTLDDPAAGVYLPPQRRRVGVVFQDHRLFAHLRVVDNVAYGSRAAGTRAAPARAAATQWLERLGVADFAQRRPRQLSGGQAQRVALARALASEPDALVLDEPLAALDVQTRAQVQGELRQHLSSFAGPTVLVTHDPVEAVLLASRIVVLERGQVVQSGTPAEITTRPLTPYVARMVGMNLYSGHAGDGARVADASPVTAALHAVTLDGGGALTVESGPSGAVLVVVRPSSITVHDRQPLPVPARTDWPGTVASLAPLGDRVRLSVHGPPDALVDVTATAVAHLGLHPGRAIWLSVPGTEVTAFARPLAP